MFDVKAKTSPKELDCGATCLQMLLDFYGIDVGLAELTSDCRTTLAGCTGTDLKRAGEAHGLQIKAYKMDAEEVLKMDRPSIIHWKHNHWCICCGTTENGDVVICNPDRGRYPIKRNTFDCYYTGVALFNGEPIEMEAQPTQADRIKTLEE